MTSTLSNLIGETVHFLAAKTVGIDQYHSAVLSYGDELVITSEIIELSTDRNGGSWLDGIGTPSSSARLGSWPAGEPRLLTGSFEWQEARASARAAAFAMPDEPERRAAPRKGDSEFSPGQITSRILSVTKDS
jgi:hypothetical protein